MGSESVQLELPIYKEDKVTTHGDARLVDNQSFPRHLKFIDKVEKPFDMVWEWLISNPPSRWPNLPRRIFVLTFPISAPLWLFGWLTLFFTFLVVSALIFIPLELLNCMVHLWKKPDERRKDN